MLFLDKFKNIIDFEKVLSAHPRELSVLREAKRLGISDKYIARVWNMAESEIFLLRKENGILPVYKMIDTCASEFDSYVPYFYSTYETENESGSKPEAKNSCARLRADPYRAGR